MTIQECANTCRKSSTHFTISDYENWKGNCYCNIECKFTVESEVFNALFEIEETPSKS